MLKEPEIRQQRRTCKAAAAYVLWAINVVQVATADPVSIALVEGSEMTFAAPDLCCLSYRIINMPLSDFLTLLSEDAGVRVAQPDGLRGLLSNTYLTGDVNAILDTLSVEQGLDWFVFNGVYYISLKSDAVTRLIPLDGISIVQARHALERSGLSLDGTNINSAANETALAVYGGSAFIGIVEAILSVTPGVTAAQAPDAAIRVRRGSESAIEYFGVVDRDLINPAPADEREPDDLTSPDPEPNGELSNG